MELIRTKRYTIEVNVVELVVPTFALLLSIYYFFDTRDLPERSMLYAEPLLLVTVILSIIVISLFGIEFDTKDTTDSESKNSMVGYINNRSVNYEDPVLILLLTVGYLALFPITFEIATFVYLFSSLYVLGERNLQVLPLYALVLTITIFVVFKWWLNIPL